MRQTNIIDVYRKPTKCPVCGERVVDIIYGTGDMTEPEFLFAYRREGMMGGDNIPRRPPIWACSCGCKRFRKINFDGTDAPVKPKLLKNIRKGSLEKFTFTDSSVEEAIRENRMSDIHHYKMHVSTEYGEKEAFWVDATSYDAAFEIAKHMVATGKIGLKGKECRTLGIIDEK